MLEFIVPTESSLRDFAFAARTFRSAKSVLIAGPSGVGKSHLAHELQALGYSVVDSDAYGYRSSQNDGSRRWFVNWVALLHDNPSVDFIIGTSDDYHFVTGRSTSICLVRVQIDPYSFRAIQLAKMRFFQKEKPGDIYSIGRYLEKSQLIDSRVHAYFDTWWLSRFPDRDPDILLVQEPDIAPDADAFFGDSFSIGGSRL
jgi:hypothetical protein